FTTLTTYEGISKSRLFSIAIVDFNKDNQSDIVVANYGTNNVLVMSRYFNEPSAKQTNYLNRSHTGVTCTVIADFNNDNYLDIVANVLSKGDLLLLVGDGNGTFVGKKEISAGYESFVQQLRAKDLNNDNRMDIVTANRGSDSVGVILGDADENFAMVVTYPTGIGSSPYCVAIEDVNNDNKLDIISAKKNTYTICAVISDNYIRSIIIVQITNSDK
ncbi:unnamed protein product, partial [Rotaria sp. Silwood2]